MMEDVSSNESLPHQDPTEVAETVAETVRDDVGAVADTAQANVDAAQAAMDQGVEAASKTADETAKAFEEARGRLQGAGLDHASGLLDQFKTGTDVLNSKLGASYSRASGQMAAFNAKAIEAWRTNAEAAITHWQSLAGVKSWSEMISLNAAHTRKQIETMTAQTRELAELAGQLARDASEPIKRD